MSRFVHVVDCLAATSKICTADANAHFSTGLINFQGEGQACAHRPIATAVRLIATTRSDGWRPSVDGGNGEQEMTREDAIDYINHNIAKLRRPPANDPEWCVTSGC
jgi:hypothetical protein